MRYLGKYPHGSYSRIAVAKPGQNILLQDIGLHGYRALHRTIGGPGNTHHTGCDLLFP